MNGYTLNGAPWFESLPDFKLLLNIKWNSYIRPTAKEHIKKHGWFLVPLQKVSNHSCIFYLYKTRIRPKMNAIYWAEEAQALRFSLSRIQKHLPGFVSDGLFSTLLSISQRWEVKNPSILYLYLHGKSSVELYSLIPPVQIFADHTMYFRAKYHSFLSHPFGKKIVPSR